MIGRTNAGGGGSKEVYAIISVSYPVDSICTCSDGVITLRARGTYGSFDFNVPYAGTWTVSCTNGTKTASKNVVITSDLRYTTVTLLYELVIYDAGYVNPIAGEIDTHRYNTNSYYSTNDTNIYSHGSAGDSSVWQQTLLFKELIDITPLQYLKMSYSLSFSAPHGSYFNVFGLTARSSASSITGNASNIEVVRAEIPSGGSEASPAVLSIDVSNVNAAYRIANATNGYWGSMNLYIYKIWFE